MNASIASPDQGPYELRFRPVFGDRGALAFPCDAGGQVDLDSMTDKTRIAYLYARTVVGREFFMPVVRVAVLH